MWNDIVAPRLTSHVYAYQANRETIVAECQVILEQLMECADVVEEARERDEIRERALAVDVPPDVNASPSNTSITDLVESEYIPTLREEDCLALVNDGRRYSRGAPLDSNGELRKLSPQWHSY